MELVQYEKEQARLDKFDEKQVRRPPRPTESLSFETVARPTPLSFCFLLGMYSRIDGRGEAASGRILLRANVMNNALMLGHKSAGSPSRTVEGWPTATQMTLLTCKYRAEDRDIKAAVGY